MILQIQHIIPDPLSAPLQGDSEVWGRSLVLNPGDRVLFRAPSGKGKSTFIHILYGLRQDYSGTVFWDKHNVKEQDAATWAGWRSKNLSIVFQDLRLFPELTLAENLAIKQSLAPDRSLDEAREWACMLGLEDKWNQEAATLSYGEKQRTAIIRALLQPFQWLLLDEPFSHLDNANILLAAALIEKRLRERQAGLIMADLEDERRLAFSQKMLL